ncbi:MAG: GNAT family N-acetyltransferase [Candidatus Omnitrophica bacterium]|nr:GNAT family N-acetyltransferase [Candidatus Omnitrophota bacterium]
MRLKSTIQGKYICLRTAMEEDAEFILSLRLDPQLNVFIGATDPSLEKQRQWLRQKQEVVDDYSMIIEDLDGHRLGTVAVYQVDQQHKTFEWGRWIIAPRQELHVAIESAFWVYSFGFYVLGLETALFGTQKKNTSVVRFHRSYANVTHEDSEALYFKFQKDDFHKIFSEHRLFRKYMNKDFQSMIKGKIS